MRRYLPLLLILLPLIAGCAGTRPYTAKDLRQVNRAYDQLAPIFTQFQAAYNQNNLPAMRRLYAREQRACRLVDTIDKRDSIDPNTNLFTASSYLDSFCNDIETAYASWRKAHHLPYDHAAFLSAPGTYFVDGDYNIVHFHDLMKHPAAFCCAVLTVTPGPSPTATPYVTPTPVP